MPPGNEKLNEATSEDINTRGRLKLPFTTVVSIAMNGLKIRFWRSMVTAAGIFLGIAFFSNVVTNLALAGASNPDHARMVWLVVMSLLVSLVGIINSMLMSVTERYREIGTMKCLGAPDGFVVNLFIIEAVFVGIVASAAGWLVGFVCSILGKAFEIGLVPAFAVIGAARSAEYAGISIGLGAFITLIATIVPAQTAAAMPAAAALRTDI